MVNRRVGGLENNAAVGGVPNSVNRRVGGLEKITAILSSPAVVNRRVGGVGVKSVEQCHVRAKEKVATCM